MMLDSENKVKICKTVEYACACVICMLNIELVDPEVSEHAIAKSM